MHSWGAAYDELSKIASEGRGLSMLGEVVVVSLVSLCCMTTTDFNRAQFKRQVAEFAAQRAPYTACLRLAVETTLGEDAAEDTVQMDLTKRLHRQAWLLVNEVRLSPIDKHRVSPNPVPYFDALPLV